MDPLREFFPADPSRPVALLGAADLARILTAKLCFEALQGAYRDLAEDPECQPKTLGLHGAGGTFHVKAGLYPKARDVLAAKLNANFPSNPGRGLPTIQGLVLLSDARCGVPLAVLDSGELTAIRTAAAAALAAHFGGRPDSRTLGLIGCGRQAGYVLEAVARIFPLARVRVFDRDGTRAKAFAETHGNKTALHIDAVASAAEAARESDLVVTCTTSAKPVLMAGEVRAGAFIAALGADNPDKQEIDPELFRGAGILVDDRAQCAAGGDLHHALKAGAVTEADVRADLCELAAGKAKARKNDGEIVLFDSTGTGLQDVAAARAAFAALTAASAASTSG